MTCATKIVLKVHQSTILGRYYYQNGKKGKIEDIMILTLLEYKECNEAAIGKMPAKYENTEAEWKKKDLKARAIIMSAISNKQLEYISECKIAYEMIKKIDKMYLTRSTAMHIICRRINL